MKAIAVTDDGLSWQDHEPSQLESPDDVRILNHATAINRADLSQREGGYPPPPGASEILGLECAGEVIEIGRNVTGVAIGDRVCALLAGGGYAEEVVVPSQQVLPIPDGYSYEEAAAIPEVFATAYLNLFIEAGLKDRESVLLHAGGSGVGTAAIQLSRAANCSSYVTAGSDDKLNRCFDLGAANGINRHAVSGLFAETVMKWTANKGVNVILDPVGAGYLTENLKCLAVDGRLVIIGLLGGANATLPLGRLMMKRQRIIGSTLRARSIEQKAEILASLRRFAWSLFEKRTIEPIIDQVLTIEECATAHELVRSDTTFGKVVLRIR